MTRTWATPSKREPEGGEAGEEQGHVPVCDLSYIDTRRALSAIVEIDDDEFYWDDVASELLDNDLERLARKKEIMEFQMKNFISTT